MAYRITYEWQKERELVPKSGSFRWVWGVALVAAALAIRLLVPESAEVFRDLLHPLTDEHTIAIFSEMIDHIGDGVPLSDAITVFCREILSHG